MNDVLSFSKAAARRDAGIEQAADHADRAVPNWSGDAEAAIGHYCRAHAGQQFLGEDIRQWAEDMQYVSCATDGRAWGAVMRRAAMTGVLRKVGYAPARSSNLSPKCLWEAA